MESNRPSKPKKKQKAWFTFKPKAKVQVAATGHHFTYSTPVLSLIGQRLELPGAKIASLQIDKAAGAMYTFPADALGVPTEFSAYRPLGFKHIESFHLFDDNISGPGFMRSGQWSDDASQAACWTMALMQANQIREQKEADNKPLKPEEYNNLLTNLFARLLYRWYKQGLNSGLTEGQQQSMSSQGIASIGCGGVVLKFMQYWEQIEKDHDTSQEKFLFNHDHARRYAQYCKDKGFTRLDGNAATMRNGATAVYAKSAEEAMKLADLQSRTTTPGEEVSACAQLQAYLAYLGIHELTDESPAACKAILLSPKTFADFLRLYEEIHHKVPPRSIVALCHSAIDNLEPHPEKRDWTNWRCGEGKYKHDTTYDPNYYGSYATEGMALVLHAIYNTNSLTDTLSWLANAGGDADSNCAVAMTILGAIYGYSEIPQEWIKGVNRHSLTQRPAGKFDKLTQKAMALAHGNVPAHLAKPHDLVENALTSAMPAEYQQILLLTEKGPQLKMRNIIEHSYPNKLHPDWRPISIQELEYLACNQPLVQEVYEVYEERNQPEGEQFLKKYVLLGDSGYRLVGYQNIYELLTEGKNAKEVSVLHWKLFFNTPDLSKFPFTKQDLKKEDLIAYLKTLEHDVSSEARRFKCHAFSYLGGKPWTGESLEAVLGCQKITTSREIACFEENKMQLWHQDVVIYQEAVTVFEHMEKERDLNDQEKKQIRLPKAGLFLASLAPGASPIGLVTQANTTGAPILIRQGNKFKFITKNADDQWMCYDVNINPNVRPDVHFQNLLMYLPFPKVGENNVPYNPLFLSIQIRERMFGQAPAVAQHVPPPVQKKLSSQEMALLFAANNQEINLDTIKNAYAEILAPIIENNMIIVVAYYEQKENRPLQIEEKKQLREMYIQESLPELRERLIQTIDDLFIHNHTNFNRLKDMFGNKHPQEAFRDWENLHQCLLYTAQVWPDLTTGNRKIADIIGATTKKQTELMLRGLKTKITDPTKNTAPIIPIYGAAGEVKITLAQFQKLLCDLTGDSQLKVLPEPRHFNQPHDGLKLRIYPSYKEFQYFGHLTSSYDENLIPYYEITISENWEPHPQAALLGITYYHRGNTHSISPSRLVDHLEPKEFDQLFSPEENHDLTKHESSTAPSYLPLINIQALMPKKDAVPPDRPEEKALIPEDDNTKELVPDQLEEEHRSNQPVSVLNATKVDDPQNKLVSVTHPASLFKHPLPSPIIKKSNNKESGQGFENDPVIGSFKTINTYFKHYVEGLYSIGSTMTHAHPKDLSARRDHWINVLSAIDNYLKKIDTNEADYAQAILLSVIEEAHHFDHLGTSNRYYTHLNTLKDLLEGGGFKKLQNDPDLVTELQYRAQSYKQIHKQLRRLDEIHAQGHSHGLFSKKPITNEDAIKRQNANYWLFYEKLLRKDDQACFMPPIPFGEEKKLGLGPMTIEKNI